MIYAIRALGTPYIKFGFTTKGNVQERVEEMQTGCPFELKAVAWAKGDRSAEQWIHLRLKRAKAHHRGEWFVECDEAEKIIREMREMTNEPASNQVIAHLCNLNGSGKRLGRILELSKRITAANRSEETAGEPSSRAA